MSPRPDLGPKPLLGYTASLIERAAERRADLAAMSALEADANGRTYVVGGEMVVLNKGAEIHDPLFTLGQARALARTAEIVFLGLIDGAPRFAVALDPADAEALKTRGDLYVTDLRSISSSPIICRLWRKARRCSPGMPGTASVRIAGHRAMSWKRAGGAIAHPAAPSISPAPTRS
jgi:hypothetical protein